jgi:phosphonate transport system ATP-binding protein
MGSAAPPVLQARGLGCRRGGRWLFRGLDINIHAGDFLALVGPSGVGKSTLLGCLCGQLEPCEGEVRINLLGRPEPPRARRQAFGIVYQDLQLTQSADILTNVLCGKLGQLSTWRSIFGFPRKLREDAYALLCELGIGADPGKWVSQMSGGERQRVALARALLQDPEIFFTDEPVSSLDSYLAGRVLGLLRQQADLQARPVICVLHQSEHINRFADLSLSLHPADPYGHKLRHIRPGPEEVSS